MSEITEIELAEQITVIQVSPQGLVLNENGWAPQLALTKYGNDGMVMRVTGWSGGTGERPAVGYLGPQGVVARPSQATFIGTTEIIQGSRGVVDFDHLADAVANSIRAAFVDAQADGMVLTLVRDGQPDVEVTLRPSKRGLSETLGPTVRSARIVNAALQGIDRDETGAETPFRDPLPMTGPKRRPATKARHWAF